MKQYVLSLSGGLDSTVLCASLLAEQGPTAVLPVFFRYGSKHNTWEEQAALRIAQHFSLRLKVFDLTPVFSHMKSALLQHDPRPIPQADYDNSSMAQTVVPGRNLIFASILAAYAESHGAAFVTLATHAGDHCLYPDCRPAFNDALATTLLESSGESVQLVTPFSTMDKNAIVALGQKLLVPFDLTRSCYQDQGLSCGTCGTCRERLDAFAANGIADPLPYAG